MYIEQYIMSTCTCTNIAFALRISPALPYFTILYHTASDRELSGSQRLSQAISVFLSLSLSLCVYMQVLYGLCANSATRVSSKTCRVRELSLINNLCCRDIFDVMRQNLSEMQLTGNELRTPGLYSQCSATELQQLGNQQHPPSSIFLSPFATLAHCSLYCR